MFISFPDPYALDPVSPWILLLAMFLDAVIGDPNWLYRRVPHPVALIGEVVGRLEVALNSPKAEDASKRFAGILMAFAVIGFCALFGWMLGWGLRLIPFEEAWIGEALLVAVLVANRDLYGHVRRVADGLDVDLAAGRHAVSHIVGRDPNNLDKAGVARAAIESAAENFSDGVVAPLFFYVLFGLPGIFAYKAINTLDSMVGYRSERYRAFGWASARIDDLVNLLPARLAGGIFVVSALVVPKAGGAQALKTMLRDASRHRSPNAGWPEAAMAGALGLALAGPRIYRDHHVDDAWMGDGRPEASAQDIRRALNLYAVAGILTVVLGFLVLRI